MLSPEEQNLSIHIKSLKQIFHANQCLWQQQNITQVHQPYR